MHIGLAMPASMIRLKDLLDIKSFEIEEAPSFSDYIRELISRDHYISLFSLTPHVNKIEILEGESLKVWLIPSRHAKRTRNFYKTEISKVFDAYTQSKNLDILHTHWLHEYTTAALKLNIPHLVTAHDAPLPIARYQRPFMYWALRSIFASLVLTKIKNLVVISPYLMNYYRNLHLYKGRLDVIPSFTAPDAYRMYGTTSPNPEGELVFGAVLNGYNPRKNSNTLISAFQKYRKSYPNARLILFGHGHGTNQEAESWASKNNLTKNIEFAGATVNDLLLSRLASEVDIIVHPALEESFGIAVADALALGKPVIGGKDCGAVPWVLNDGKAGHLTNMRNSTELANAMIFLTKHADERKRLSFIGHEHAKANFHTSSVADKYIALYKNLSVT